MRTQDTNQTEQQIRSLLGPSATGCNKLRLSAEVLDGFGRELASHGLTGDRVAEIAAHLGAVAEDLRGSSALWSDGMTEALTLISTAALESDPA